jgi:hypothetical protein
MPPRRPVRQSPKVRAPSVEDEALDDLMRASRIEEYRNSLASVVHHARVYAAELERDDPAHRGRLATRERALHDAILATAKAWEGRGSTYADPDQREMYRRFVSDEEFAEAIRKVESRRRFHSMSPDEQAQTYKDVLRVSRRPRPGETS